MKKNIGTKNQIVSHLSYGQNVSVGSLPGMGLNTLVKIVKKELNASQTKYYNLTLFPHESQLKDYKAIKRLFFEKIRLENDLISDNTHSLDSFLLSLKSNEKLLIVINKFNDWADQQLVLSYLNSFYRANQNKVVILISSKLETFKAISEKNLSLSLSPILFSGFRNDYEKYFDKILLQFNLPSELKSYSEQIFTYCFGHIGLLKSTLLAHRGKSELLMPSDLLKNKDILRRIREIFAELQNCGVNLNCLKNNLACDEFEVLGISYRGVTAELINEYYKTFEFDRESIYQVLTTTECTIFRILEDTDEYIDLDKIAFLLGGSSYEDISDWMLYKHINNINKKISVFDLLVKNKRGVGYKVVSTKVSET